MIVEFLLWFDVFKFMREGSLSSPTISTCIGILTHNCILSRISFPTTGTTRGLIQESNIILYTVTVSHYATLGQYTASGYGCFFQRLLSFLSTCPRGVIITSHIKRVHRHSTETLLNVWVVLHVCYICIYILQSSLTLAWPLYIVTEWVSSSLFPWKICTPIEPS